MERHHSSWTSVKLRSSGNAAGLTARTLHERQREFAAAILDSAQPVPRGLVGPDREPDAKRFNVYRNNVVAGLVETLKAAFPAVRRIVGDDFFAAMARVYVTLEPPASPVMLDYGATFADFIGTFAPAMSVPYLRDVARLERAWVEAYHAAEASPIDPAELAAVRSASLSQISLTLHPSVRVMRSSFPVVSLWQMNIEGGMPAALDLSCEGEDALVIRPVAEVEVRTLPGGAAAFILGLMTGVTVAGATTLALDDEPRFDLAGALRDLLAVSAIVGWNLGDGFRQREIGRGA
jgi:Putative DNA-binding domain